MTINLSFSSFFYWQAGNYTHPPVQHEQEQSGRPINSTNAPQGTLTNSPNSSNLQIEGVQIIPVPQHQSPTDKTIVLQPHQISVLGAQTSIEAINIQPQGLPQNGIQSTIGEPIQQVEIQDPTNGVSVGSDAQTLALKCVTNAICNGLFFSLYATVCPSIAVCSGATAHCGPSIASASLNSILGASVLGASVVSVPYGCLSPILPRCGIRQPNDPGQEGLFQDPPITLMAAMPATSALGAALLHTNVPAAAAASTGGPICLGAIGLAAMTFVVCGND